jgi:uncharacterized membrane protein YkvA (DUF1232 family)
MDSHQFNFYERLKLQIKDWFNSNESKDFEWRDFVAKAPDCFYFVASLATEEDLPIDKKKRLAQAIAYFISPYDFLPEEEVGAAGFLDDLTVCSIILKDVLPGVEPALIKKYWKCDIDLHEFINNILSNAGTMLGKALLKKIEDKFGN